MNLSKRLEQAADRRTRARTADTSRSPMRSRSGPRLIDLEVGGGPIPSIDLRGPDEGYDPVVDFSDYPGAAPEVIAEAQPAPVEAAADEPQWSHGLSKRLGVGRFGARRAKSTEPAPAAATPAAPVVDVRSTSHTCPRCGGNARVDIHDRSRGLMHLSCDSCFKMWQQPNGESNPTSVS